MPSFPRALSRAPLSRATVAVLAAACALTTAACSGAGGAASASAASSTAASSSGTYLALGDSVPFGFRGGPSGADYTKATNFTGYPELVGKKLGLHVLNTSCPGETTASFSDVKAQSNGCENALQSAAGYRTSFPLHVSYDSPNQSQLDLAVATLKRTKNVSLVTLQIGANDGFVCQQTTADQCVSEFGTVAQTAATTIGHILTALRTDGGYRGKVVLVTYYAVSYVGGAAASSQILDAAITQAASAAGATVADGFVPFQSVAQKSGGDPVAAGLVIRGDVHPTAKGQQLLADAVEKAVAG